MSDPLQLRRDTTPVLVCGCGHMEAEHNAETKAQKCLRSGCGCRTFRLVEQRWRIHGWLIEPIRTAG
jgi:hypothetical protein